MQRRTSDINENKNENENENENGKDIIKKVDKLIAFYENDFVVDITSNKGLYFNPELKKNKEIKKRLAVTSSLGRYNIPGPGAEKSWSNVIARIDYETIALDVKLPHKVMSNNNKNKNKEKDNNQKQQTSSINVSHDNALRCIHLSALLSRNGYRVITFNEVPVGSHDIVVNDIDQDSGSNRSNSGGDYTLIGSIDFLCLSPEGELVVCEVKSLINKYNMSTESLLLKMDHARQLHIYGRMLELMYEKMNQGTDGDNNGSKLEVSHYLLFGYYEANNTMSLWKIHKNNDKWLGAKFDKNQKTGKSNAYFWPMVIYLKEDNGDCESGSENEDEYTYVTPNKNKSGKNES